MEYGPEEMAGFSMISDGQLDNLVERFMSDHGTLVGYSLVSGHLRSLGLRVQRDRIRESISRVDPGNSGPSFFLGEHNYSVAGPQIAYCILTDTIAW